MTMAKKKTPVLTAQCLPRQLKYYYYLYTTAAWYTAAAAAVAYYINTTAEVTDRACVYAIYIAHTERGPPECSCFDVFITLWENREYLLGSPRFTPNGHDINTACTRPEFARGEKNLTKSFGPIYPYSLYRGSHPVAHLTRVTSCV